MKTLIMIVGQMANGTNLSGLADPSGLYAARDETAALADEVAQVEQETDQRVVRLCGV